jgi:streptomycin 6-kinase
VDYSPGRVAGVLFSPEFGHFIARHYGARGRQWLEDLPGRVEYYARLWALEIDHYFADGLASCCLAVRTSDRAEAVLKLAGPWTPARNEIAALLFWSGEGVPTLLQSDAAGGVLLIERINPGLTFAGFEDPAAVEQTAALLRALHARRPTRELIRELPSLASVVERLIVVAGEEAEARSHTEATALRPTLDAANRAARALLDDWDGRSALLHGDLESSNILVCSRQGLVAVDPLPSIGDPAFDAGYLAAQAPIEDREELSARLGQALGIDPRRVRIWATIVGLEGDH